MVKLKNDSGLVTGIAVHMDTAEISGAAIRFEIARRVALVLKNRRNECLCEETESAEPEVGLDEISPCWKRYIDIYDDQERLGESEWCETCRRRQRLHEAYRRAMKIRGGRMRTFQRVALKGIEIGSIQEEMRRMEGHEGAAEETKEPVPQGDGDARPADVVDETKPEGSSAQSE